MKYDIEMLYEDLAHQKYSDKQINQILKAEEDDIQLTKYISPENTVDEIRTIRQIIEIYKHDSKNLEQIDNAIKKDIDISTLNDKFCKMNPDTMEVYLMALELRYTDIEKYKHEHFNKCQAKYIKKGLTKRLNLKSFYNDEYTPREIDFIIKNITNKDFEVLKLLTQGYKIQSIIKLNENKELIPYTTKSINPEMIDAYKILYDYLKEEKRLCDFSKYTNNLKTPNQLKLVVEAMKNGINPENELMNYNYNIHQLRVIYKGLLDGININVYKNSDFTAKQMDMLRILETRIEKRNHYEKCDINIIKDDEMPADEMKRKIDLYDIINTYNNELDLNKMFKNNKSEDILKMVGKIIYQKTGYNKIFKEYKINNEIER